MAYVTPVAKTLAAPLHVPVHILRTAMSSKTLEPYWMIVINVAIKARPWLYVHTSHRTASNRTFVPKNILQRT